MSILSWNCRGLGNHRSVRDLCRLVKEKRPSLVFLMETKMLSKCLEKIRLKIGFGNVFGVDSVGRSGGLALFWNDSLSVEIQNFSRRHINAIVGADGRNQLWKFTGFYGNSKPWKRKEGWDILRHLNTLSPSAWLCVGDFNEILCDSEKFGAAARPRWQMTNFRDMVDSCHLLDLGFSGPTFTWCNRQGGASFIKERLDRAMANSKWCDLFPSQQVCILAARSSDHAPLLLSLQGSGNFRRSGYQRFHYETGWQKNERVREVIRKVWRVKATSRDAWGAVKTKLNNSRRGLLRWKRCQPYHPEVALQEKTAAIQTLQAVDGVLDLEAIRGLQTEVDELLEQDKLKWRQRAKEHWLQLGDKNTKFFHASATQRKRKTEITTVQDIAGRTCATPIAVQEAFTGYFQSIFTSTEPTCIEDSIATVSCQVSSQMNEQLLKEFTAEEVSIALSQMAPLKAPGPDGFPVCFFQDNWEGVGKEVCAAALTFF
jgi:hypothetical protein